MFAAPGDADNHRAQLIASAIAIPSSCRGVTVPRPPGASLLLRLAKASRWLPIAGGGGAARHLVRVFDVGSEAESLDK